MSSQFETFLLLLLLWTIRRSTWTRTVCREGRLLNGVEVLKQGHATVMVVGPGTESIEEEDDEVQ